MSTASCEVGASTPAEVLARVTAGLAARFRDVGLGDIDRVVRACRADLSGLPHGAVPEMLWRLAHQRLLDPDDPAGRRPEGTSGHARSAVR